MIFVLFILGFCLLDIFRGANHQDTGFVRNGRYNPPYVLDGTYRDEACEVYVAGDEFDGWFDIDCYQYYRMDSNQRVVVRWIEGRMSGYSHNRKAWISQ